VQPIGSLDEDALDYLPIDDEQRELIACLADRVAGDDFAIVYVSRIALLCSMPRARAYETFADHLNPAHPRTSFLLERLAARAPGLASHFLYFDGVEVDLFTVSPSPALKRAVADAACGLHAGTC
jgi:hypothetical protein